jgi:hypothetical protein
MGVALTAEHSPLAAQKHEPPVVLAVVQHKLPEHEERLPLAKIEQSQSPGFAPLSHLTVSQTHEPEPGQPGSAQQIPGAPRTAGLHGTVFEGPAELHPHEPSSLTLLTHEIPPPPDEVPPELPPEPDPEEEPLPPPLADPPELPLPPEDPEDDPEEDPDEELAEASGEELPLPEHPPSATRASDAAPAESRRARERRIDPWYASRNERLPSRP